MAKYAERATTNLDIHYINCRNQIALTLPAQRCTNNKFCSKQFLSCLPKIPGRPRAPKPAEIASLMPLLPDTRDQGKSFTPPRAKRAPETAVNSPPPNDAPPYIAIPDVGPNIILGVHGHDFVLQAPTDEHIAKATQHAITYAQHMFRQNTLAAEPRCLTEALTTLRIKYSRVEAGRLAIADANDFQFTTAHVQRDIHELCRLSSLDALIVHHNNKQKDSGLNETRVITHLSEDENFPKILEIVQNGAVADTDPAFIKSPRTAPFRELQSRLTPVYNKHAATMHAANRVLILPIDQLTQSECVDLHMANEYNWRAEPGKIAGRPLMDCSNAQPDIIPLNTETT